MIAFFDHEMAFSFLLHVSPPIRHGKSDEKYPGRTTVFYRGIEGAVPRFDRVWADKETAGEPLTAILNDLPAAWNNRVVDKIRRHARAVRQRTDEFCQGDQKEARMNRIPYSFSVLCP